MAKTTNIGYNYIAITGTYAILTTDQTISCSGAAFTVTLPSAIGLAGKTYRVIKTDSSLTNIITIATTSAQTIMGLSTVTLNTQNESWNLVSDGANWQVLAHKTISEWLGYTPVFTGFGTVASIAVVSRRVGDVLEVQGKYTVGTNTAVESRMTIGFGGTSANVTADISKNAANGVLGQLQQAVSATTIFGGDVLMPTANQTYINFGIQTSTANALTIANGSIFNNGIIMSVNFKVAILGWYA